MKAIKFTNKLIEPSEKEIQDAIMNYLTLVKFFVIKIEGGGRPLKTKGGLVMVPFMNKFYRKGCSDIFAIKDGKFYAFEVKTPKE
ncbi:hypothetical protein MUP35_01670, partial [Patescibacteria group bacterium]|nr:hypothetical protein [Patescibacteria group bacterium]